MPELYNSQSSQTWPWQNTQRVCGIKLWRCDLIYNEYVMQGILIEVPHASIRHSMHSSWILRKCTTVQYLARHFTLMTDLQQWGGWKNRIGLASLAAQERKKDQRVARKAPIVTLAIERPTSSSSKQGPPTIHIPAIPLRYPVWMQVTHLPLQQRPLRSTPPFSACVLARDIYCHAAV